MKRIFNQIKKYLSRNKNKDEYIPYGMGPGFTIWTNTGSCIMGHISVKKTDTKEEITYKLITLIVNQCKLNEIGIEKTIDTIIRNLVSNNLFSSGDFVKILRDNKLNEIGI